MSDRRIQEICDELNLLKRKHNDLENELRDLQEKKHKDILASLAHVPRDLKKTVAAWKEGLVTREEIQHLWDLLWGNCRGKDFFTYRGQNVFDVVTDILDDVEYGMAEIYFSLADNRFIGPFRYGCDEEEAEAQQWSTDESSFCAFAK